MTTKTLSGFRLVETRRGDTLQRIASRELGSATRWYELAEINKLRPPYLTDDEDQASDSVKLTGSQLLVPSTTPVATADTSPESIFGTDVLLKNGRLRVSDGDLVLVSGVDNYLQALGHVVVTEPGDLMFHPEYGCGVRRMIGSSNSRAKITLAGGLVRKAVASDPRTKEVKSATVRAVGDSLFVEGEAIAINQRPARFSEAL